MLYEGILSADFDLKDSDIFTFAEAGGKMVTFHMTAKSVWIDTNSLYTDLNNYAREREGGMNMRTLSNIMKLFNPVVDRVRFLHMGPRKGYSDNVFALAVAIMYLCKADEDQIIPQLKKWVKVTNAIDLALNDGPKPEWKYWSSKDSVVVSLAIGRRKPIFKFSIDLR